MASTPTYLGSEEVQGIFLGIDEVPEMYLGTDLVYQSGPFQGIKLSPRDISFNAASLSSQLKVKSSEAWSMTLPAWISASQTTGDSGETIVTMTATTQTATTTGTVSVTTANYSASADVTYYDVELVNYVYENSGSYIQSHNLDTGIAHTASTMTVQLKYKARGGNSDRMVGYQDGDVGCSSDSNDFRIFGYRDGTFDYKTGRWSTGTINANGQAYDITIGDGFCLDNTNQVYRVQQTATGVVPSPNCHIYVDMSYIKVKEIIIMDGNSVLYDGKAAKLGNDYGLFDTVSGEFLTSSDFTIVGETSN